MLDRLAQIAADWELFKYSWLSGLLVAVVLANVGVFVVARDQIFLGAAVSQASALGIALSLGVASWSGAARPEWIDSPVVPATLAVSFSVLASWATALSARARESHEAVTGFVFLCSASFAVLAVSQSAHGLEEVHQLLFSTIIGATEADTWFLGALGVATFGASFAFRRRLLLFTLDPVLARALGLRLGLWSVLVYGWLGLAVGYSLKVAGLLYTFGCLVLPALVAKNLTREVRPMLWVAPLVALAAGVLGFAMAHVLNVPPAPMVVALLCCAMAPAWLLRWYRGR
jgi:ABC-type Mn2+/Zn2+ transport system permease subunit